MTMTPEKIAGLLESCENGIARITREDLVSLLALAERALEPQPDTFLADVKKLAASVLGDCYLGKLEEEELAAKVKKAAFQIALEPQWQALPKLPEPVDEVLCYDQHPNGVAGRLITTSMPAADDYFTADQMVARYNNGCVAGYASGFAAGRASQLALPAGPVPADAAHVQAARKALAELREAVEGCANALQEGEGFDEAWGKVTQAEGQAHKWLLMDAGNVPARLRAIKNEQAAHSPAVAQPVPEGYKLVPKRATREMLIAAGFERGDGEEQWEAMISAAPQPPVPSTAWAQDTSQIQRLKDAIEGECEGLAIDDKQATTILQHVGAVAQPVADERDDAMAPAKDTP